MRRDNAFFIETSCAILLYDSIGHPTKHPHHKELIYFALESLELMINDDPVTNAIQHIQKIVNAVEDSLSSRQVPNAGYPSKSPIQSGEASPNRSSLPPSQLDFHPSSDIPFPSFLDLLPLDPSFLFSDQDPGMEADVLDGAFPGPLQETL